MPGGKRAGEKDLVDTGVGVGGNLTGGKSLGGKVRWESAGGGGRRRGGGGKTPGGGGPPRPSSALGEYLHGQCFRNGGGTRGAAPGITGLPPVCPHPPIKISDPSPSPTDPMHSPHTRSFTRGVYQQWRTFRLGDGPFSHVICPWQNGPSQVRWSVNVAGEC